MMSTVIVDTFWNSWKSAI